MVMEKSILKLNKNKELKIGIIGLIYVGLLLMGEAKSFKEPYSQQY